MKRIWCRWFGHNWDNGRGIAGYCMRCRDEDARPDLTPGPTRP